jgi:hypothetical protein
MSAVLVVLAILSIGRRDDDDDEGEDVSIHSPTPGSAASSSTPVRSWGR